MPPYHHHWWIILQFPFVWVRFCWNSAWSILVMMNGTFSSVFRLQNFLSLRNLFFLGRDKNHHYRLKTPILLFVDWGVFNLWRFIHKVNFLLSHSWIRYASQQTNGIRFIFNPNSMRMLLHTSYLVLIWSLLINFMCCPTAPWLPLILAWMNCSSGWLYFLFKCWF